MTLSVANVALEANNTANKVTFLLRQEVRHAKKKRSTNTHTHTQIPNTNTLHKR